MTSHLQRQRTDKFRGVVFESRYRSRRPNAAPHVNIMCSINPSKYANSSDYELPLSHNQPVWPRMPFVVLKNEHARAKPQIPGCVDADFWPICLTKRIGFDM